jgi:2-polyprenyl-3-methyl-5-hydroxy-6-metoxy-1,4-benzoquinol methylase
MMTERLRARLRRAVQSVRARASPDGGVTTTPPEAPPSVDDTATWFTSHYDQAAQAIVEFLGNLHFSLTGADVADVGCGDGIIDLGLAHKAKPRRLVGYDVDLTDEDHLKNDAARAGLAPELPQCLEFVRSEPARIPAEDESFDFVVTWSAFEHIADPAAVAREMRRIIRPSGVLFLQLWPFFHSEHGSHLWDWFPGENFIQLTRSPEEIEAVLRANPRGPIPDWNEVMLHEFRSLNRITLDELQRALLDGGFVVRALDIETPVVNLPAEAARYRLADLGIAGVKLLGVPR